MNATSIKTASSVDTISGEIKKIIQPKNKIIGAPIKLPIIALIINIDQTIILIL